MLSINIKKEKQVEEIETFHFRAIFTYYEWILKIFIGR